MSNVRLFFALIAFILISDVGRSRTGPQTEKRSYFNGAIAVEVDTHGVFCKSVVSVNVYQAGKWQLSFSQASTPSEPVVPDLSIDVASAPREIITIQDIPYLLHITVTDLDHGGKTEGQFFIR